MLLQVQWLGPWEENRILKKRDDLLKLQRARNAAEYSTFLFPSLSSDTSILPPKPREVVVWVSCYEIYNENIYDLLVPLERGQRRTLKLGEDRNHRSYVKDLTEVPVQTAEDAYGLFCTARRNLSIAETRLNQSSSRSHCMFNVRLVRCDEDGPAVSCLTLCDLAGSNNPTKTGNMGSRLREAGRINNSLVVLGRCLKALRLGKGAEKWAPFRDSKLTQVSDGISASVTGFRAARTFISLLHSVRYCVRKRVSRWSCLVTKRHRSNFICFGATLYVSFVYSLRLQVAASHGKRADNA